jgi:hypothetical protein
VELVEALGETKFVFPARRPRKCHEVGSPHPRARRRRVPAKKLRGGLRFAPR